MVWDSDKLVLNIDSRDPVHCCVGFLGNYCFEAGARNASVVLSSGLRYGKFCGSPWLELAPSWEPPIDQLDHSKSREHYSPVRGHC